MRVKGIPAYLLFLFALLAPWAAAAASDPPAAIVQPDRQSLGLTPHLRWHHDPHGQLDHVGAFELADAGREFGALASDPTFGFGQGGFWFHATLRNEGHPETRWLLVLEYALLDHIDLWLRYPDGRLVHQRSGDLEPFDARAIDYRHPNFWVELPPGEPVQLLLRAESKSSMQVPLSLRTQANFAELVHDSQFGHGLHFGILLALLLYNLILWLALRDASHFWFFTHLGAIGLVLLCLYGLAFQWLWPDSPWLANVAVPVSMNLGLLAMHQFSRNFLDLPAQWPLGSRISVGFILFHAALLGLSLVIDYRTAVLLSTASVFPGVALLIWQAIVTLRQDYRPARVFLLAWLALLAGMSAYAMVSFDLLPKTFLTEYGIQIGATAEMLLLSVALAHRYAALRDENARIVRETNTRLERSVASRTRELSAALEQLAAANGRLREANRRDSLTGLFNRPHFLQVFARMLDDARTSGMPVAVLMIDVDHFKRINDTLGHPAGDACLHRVARNLEDALARHGGVVARFGGEEFAAALPGLGLEQAMRVAEQLRQDIAADSLLIESRELRVTVSIGVQVWTPDTPDSGEEMLRRADDALYEAKRQGRNCVRPCIAT